MPTLPDYLQAMRLEIVAKMADGVKRDPPEAAQWIGLLSDVQICIEAVDEVTEDLR
jgi:hypothetical protein